MPKYDYDPETYDADEPVFEPNRARKKDRFKKEREEKPEKQEG